MDFCHRVLFLFHCPAVPEYAAQQAGSQMRVHANHDVFDGGHVFEQANILIGPGNAFLCDAVRRVTGNIMAIEQHFPFFRRVKTGDAVKEGGFAGAIGANDAVNGSCL